MAEPSPVPVASTFVIRIWQEWSQTRLHWRGRIEHVQSGQQAAFDDPDKMLAFMRSCGIFAQNEKDEK